jgi:hypothetical protein
MNTVTPSYTRNEAVIGASPQLAASDAFASHADITLELADLSIGQLSAVAALMLSLDAAEARARSAELKLAAHARHCICHAADVDAADSYEVAALRAAA